MSTKTNDKKSCGSETQRVSQTRPGDSLAAKAMAGGDPVAPKITGTTKDVRSIVPKKIPVKATSDTHSSKKVRNISIKSIKLKKREIEIYKNKERKEPRGGSLSKTVNCMQIEKFKKIIRNFNKGKKEKSKYKSKFEKVGGSWSKTLNCMQIGNVKRLLKGIGCKKRSEKEIIMKSTFTFLVSNTRGWVKTRTVKCTKKEIKKEKQNENAKLATEIETIKKTQMKLYLLQVERQEKIIDSEKEKKREALEIREQVNINCILNRHKLTNIDRPSKEASNTQGCVKTEMQEKDCNTKKRTYMNTNRLTEVSNTQGCMKAEWIKIANKKGTKKYLIFLHTKMLLKNEMKSVKKIKRIELKENCMYNNVILQEPLLQIVQDQKELELRGTHRGIDIDDDLLDFSEGDAIDDPNSTVIGDYDLEQSMDDNCKEQLTMIPGNKGEPMQFRRELHQQAIRELKMKSRARSASASGRQRSDSVSSISSVKRKFDETSISDKQVDKKVNNKKDEDMAGAQPPPNKKPTFKEKLVGRINVEVRGNPTTELDKPDYKQITHKLMFELVKMKKTNPEIAEWDVEYSGVSQGAVYFIVNTEKTVKFLKAAVPSIEPPEVTGRSPFKYVVYGPNEHPFRYIRWRIPEMWEDTDVEDLTEILTAVNDKLVVEVNIPGGGTRKAAIACKRVLPENQEGNNKKPKPKKGNKMILVLVEVEECLIDIIVKRYRGQLMIGATKCRVEGGAVNGGPGIQEMVANYQKESSGGGASNTTEQMEDDGNLIDES